MNYMVLSEDKANSTKMDILLAESVFWSLRKKNTTTTIKKYCKK